MSHEIDFSNDRANIAYAGKVPWHGYGQEISPDENIEVWREAAGLNWEAKRSPTFYQPELSAQEVDDPNNDAGEPVLGEVLETGEDVIYRSDTGGKLGMVSPSYKVVQPAAILDFFRHYVEELGAFEMHTVGALRDGKRIWALAKSKEGLFSIGDDKVERFLLLATSFDKTMATIVQQTAIRVVCNNTLTAAYMQGETKVDPTIRISHHGEFDASKVRARMLFDEQWDEFTGAVQRWSERKVSLEEQNEFFAQVLKLPTVAEGDLKKAAARHEKLEKLHFLLREAPGQKMVSADGTAWGLVNAVTYMVDHTMGKSNDTRMDQAWFGQRRQLKARAMQAAEALVA